jgi:choline dehydrogenase-like flavoprotein
MFIDARSVPAGTTIESDLCIIGAGAAGIAMALQFLDAGLRVCVLESGALDFEADTQALYAGTSVGMSYPGIATTRLRFFGGTTNHWGGWCLPLDPIDFEPREGLPYRGWPIDRTVLDPWYEKAQKVLDLGPFDYRPASWGIQTEEIPDPFKGPHLRCSMLQTSRQPRLATVYGPTLKQADGVTVYLHANAVHLATDDAGREVQDLAVATLTGNRFTIRSKVYVLAAGGMENARLLLVSGKPDGPGLGNEHDLVGRFFMVHLEYDSSTIAVADPYTNFDFYTGELLATGGILYKPFNLDFVSFIAVTADSMRRLGLPNCKCRWTYDYEPAKQTIDAVRRLMNWSWGDPLLGDIGAVMRDLGDAGEFAWRKTLGRPALPVRSLNVHMTGEPLPNPASRIRLGDDRDALGMRRLVVDWHLTAEDKQKALALQRLLGTEVGRAGFGRLRITLADDDTTWPDKMTGDEHHMGTTRMHADPTQGVVDADCRVHGLTNLFVASSSVFPTAGAANPTLTIVALALRLADHIKRQRT